MMNRKLRSKLYKVADEIWQVVGELGDADTEKIIYLNVVDHMIAAGREAQNAIIVFEDIDTLAAQAPIN